MPLAVVLGAANVHAQAQPPQPASAGKADDGEKVFAKIGDVVIRVRDLQRQYATAARDKFYHGTPPQLEAAKLQREVAEDLINNVLINEEARRRNTPVDAKKVDDILAQFEARNANRQDWQKIRSEALPKMRLSVEAAVRREVLEKEIREQVPQQPGDKELGEYYEANKKKLFTEPEKVHVRIILLRVDPSSPRDAWDKAMEEGADLLRRLKAGEDFAELAKQHSGDPATAEEGGDMGYLHAGMLPEIAQREVDKLKPGETSEPFRGMEGIYLVRLEERLEAKLHTLDEVRERAVNLWRREAGDNAWKKFLADLRAKTPITIDESVYMPLPKETAAAGEQQEGAAKAAP
ncbi:MAG: peptidyl-prolyl cis-trans isomerase [Pseudomonadota bacterium]